MSTNRGVLKYINGHPFDLAAIAAWNEANKRARMWYDVKPFAAAGRDRTAIEHGTLSGYRKHVRREQFPCGPCREAKNEHQNKQRQRRLQRQPETKDNDNVNHLDREERRVHEQLVQLYGYDPRGNEARPTGEGNESNGSVPKA